MCFGQLGVGAGDEDAEPGVLGAAGPDLLAVDDELVAVADGPGAEVGEVAAAARLGEQLAPELLAAEDRPEVAVLLLLGAGVEDRRAGPADADRVDRAAHAGRRQLVVDQQLVDRVGVEAPRAGPVRRDVAGLGQLPAARRRVLGEPVPDGDAARIVVGRQLEVHAATLRGRRDPARHSAAAGLQSWRALRVRGAVGRCRGRRRSRRGGRGRRLGRPLRLGAGVGGRRLDLARPRRRAHVPHPPRHDADAAVAPPPGGAGEPGRHGRPAVGRPGDPVRRARRRRQRLRRVRRGVRPPRPRRADGRVPRHRHRPVGRPAVHLRAASTTRSPRRRSRRSGTPCSGPACRSGASARSTARGRWPGRCAGTACCRRWSAARTGRRSSRSPPCAARSATGPTTSSSRARARSTRPAAWADAGATWWIESMWDAIGQADPVLAALDRLHEGPPR